MSTPTLRHQSVPGSCARPGTGEVHSGSHLKMGDMFHAVYFPFHQSGFAVTH